MTTQSGAGWIIYPRRNPRATLRLFCFPYAGGGASTFGTWPDHLPPTIEVCAIQLPGRETRLTEPLLADLDHVVALLAEALAPALDGPFAFFGHSMGAQIAFELTRKLREQRGARPVRLFISGRRAPHLPPPEPPIHGLPEQAFVEQLYQRYSNIPKMLMENLELRSIFLPILRADLTLLETYVYTPQAPLDCPISVFGGLEDPRASPAQLAAWQQHTHPPITVDMFPGDHFFLNSARVPLLRAITQRLGRAL